MSTFYEQLSSMPVERRIQWLKKALPNNQEIEAQALKTDSKSVMLLADTFVKINKTEDFSLPRQTLTEETINKIKEMQKEIIEFLRSNDIPDEEDTPFFFIDYLYRGKEEVTLVIGWFDPFVGYAKWTQWDEAVSHPVYGFIELISHTELEFLFEEIHYKYKPMVSVKNTETTPSQYYPVQYARYRDFVPLVIKKISQKKKSTPVDPFDFSNFHMEEIEEEVGQRHQSVLYQEDRVYSFPHIIVELENWLLDRYLAYNRSGKPLMDLSDRLTDLQAISLSDNKLTEILELPYECQYCYWGKQEALQLGNQLYIDGVYIECEDEELQLTFTVSSDDPNRHEKWYLYHEDFFVFQAKTKETVEEFLKKTPAVFEDIPKKTFPEISQPLFLQLLTLGLQISIYLSTNDLPEKNWSEEAPEYWVDRAKAGKPKERDKAVNRLESLGYFAKYQI